MIQEIRKFSSSKTIPRMSNWLCMLCVRKTSPTQYTVARDGEEALDFLFCGRIRQP